MVAFPGLFNSSPDSNPVLTKPFFLRFRTGVAVVILALGTCAVATSGLMHTLPPWTFYPEPLVAGRVVVVPAVAVLLFCIALILNSLTNNVRIAISENDRWGEKGTSPVLIMTRRSGKHEAFFITTSAKWWRKWCGFAILSGVLCSLFFAIPALEYYQIF